MSFRKIEREDYKGYRICFDPESEYYWVEAKPGNTDTWGGIYESSDDAREAIDERLEYRVPPKDLYDYIREHQAATDASDEDMLRILCGFIALIDDTEGLPMDLGEYIVQHLERAPGDIS